MANTHQVTIGHLSFTSPGTLSYSGGGEGRTYNINGTLAHTSANNLDLTDMFSTILKRFSSPISADKSPLSIIMMSEY